MDPSVWRLLLLETLQPLSAPREGFEWPIRAPPPALPSLPATPTRTPQKCCIPRSKEGEEASCISLNTGRNLFRGWKPTAFKKSIKKRQMR